MCTCGAKLKSTTVRIIYLLSVLLNVITVYTVQVVTKICYNNHWSLTFLRLFEIDDLQWHSVLRSSFECWFFSRNNRSILFNLSSQSLMDQLILFFGVLMPKQILKEWYPYTSQLFYPPPFFSQEKKNYWSHDSSRTWGCMVRLRPAPATHDVTNRHTYNWWTVFDRRRGLNPSPDQSQRSFMPCGKQCDTPTNSRKQTIEKAQNCCEIIALH